MQPAAYVTLNKQALQHNLLRVRTLAPEARVMAVIKANAYGHGLLRTAQCLHGVDAFAVARIDEAIALREQGIQCPVTVLAGFADAEELNICITYCLQAVIHCRQQLDLLATVRGTACINIWLKLDTGMNRLGFRPEEFAGIWQCLQEIESVAKPVPLMTHLARADERHSGMTERQIRLFEQLTAQYPGERSIANSAAILAWKTALCDWVRPGIMLFGVAPFSGCRGEQLGLVPVMGLHSRLIAVKRVVAGETVGYGGVWRCSADTLMGVVGIGYGDGYPRQAPSGTPVLVNGVKVPLMGRVSMDMLTVDLSRIPDARVGDPVTLWGPALPVEEIAKYADTIPYTLLCGITQRVHIVEE